MAGTRRRRVPGISVYPRGAKWAFVISAQPDVLTGHRDRVYEGGFDTDDDAWDAAPAKKADMDRGRIIKPSGRTVQLFFAEWLAAVQPSIKKSTYANYRTNAEAYLNPVIGHHKLQSLSVPMLNAFYAHLLESGRVNADGNRAMYEYWKANRALRDGKGPTPQISTACGTSIHAAKAAVLRYRRGRIPAEQSPGLSVKSVKNIHRMLHVALRDAVAWGTPLSTLPSTPGCPGHEGAAVVGQRRGRSTNSPDGSPKRSRTASPACGCSTPPRACDAPSSPARSATG